MAEDSKIQWTTHTFNCWRGCTKVSAGCANCYAETLSGRNRKTLGVWGPNGTRVVAAEGQWSQPLKWDRVAKAAGERHRVFCASLADVFEDWDGPMHWSDGRQLWHLYPPTGTWSTNPGDVADKVPVTMQAVRERLFDLIDRTPNLDWLLLTKRPQNIARMMTPPSAFIRHGRKKQRPGLDHAHPNPFPHTTRIIEHGRIRENVWIGTSVENQQAADERIPHLLRVPAAVRFLSMEPLLGPVDIITPCGTAGDAARKGWGQLHWVIVGGESGHGARPFDLAWARSIRDQCQAAGVPFFLKQTGENVVGNGGVTWWVRNKGGELDDIPEDLRIREFPAASPDRDG